MAKEEPIGATGRRVAANVQRLREQQHLGYAELARRIGRLGRTMAPLALRRIERLQRRVDVDDLVFLAGALNVPVVRLLTEDGLALEMHLVSQAGGDD